MNHNIVDPNPVPEPSPKRPTPGIGFGLPPLRRVNAPVRPAAHRPAVQTPPAQPPQQPPSIPPIDVNKLPEFFRRDDPNRINPSAVQLYRNTLLREIGPLTLPALERFVQVLFSDDLVVESYFRPKVIDGRVGRAFDEGGCHLEAFPWREAKRASIKAGLANFLDEYPHEREFVQVAAWALPAGLFVLSHPAVQAKGEELRDLAQARETTAHIVSDAIKAMHAISAPQSRVMNALIGQGGNEGCRPRQLSRLGTALYLSQSHIHEQWVPVAGWFNLGGDDNDTADSRD
jgi:hypothetical protein